MSRFTRRDLLKSGLAVSAGAIATEKGLSSFVLSEAGGKAAELRSVSIMVKSGHDLVLQFAARDLEDYLREITGEPVTQ